MRMFNILREGEGEVNAKVYADCARLLVTPSNVESANIPHEMQELAKEITKSIRPEHFKHMTTEQAEEWLHTSLRFSRKFEQFLQKHGHRSFREGIPSKSGVTRSFAKVGLDIAAHLEPGVILIARGIDIGWCPYFPIISGIATELGSLISPGAVISREYSLPCVMGLRGVTKKIENDDYVLLDGKRGLLKILSKRKL
ncbi:phosphoenolpyruvate synthase [Nephila pilipes]|uniref:Phosphoenolpyruvate synthase n=1 Tax=Nephila pilipes TaxID=299642 RepID=A0A8X6NKP3_NEPPI|nr:phosphoenolpyruvate synthase [Nephila pilipes]